MGPFQKLELVYMLIQKDDKNVQYIIWSKTGVLNSIAIIYFLH